MVVLWLVTADRQVQAIFAYCPHVDFQPTTMRAMIGAADATGEAYVSNSEFSFVDCLPLPRQQ